MARLAPGLRSWSNVHRRFLRCRNKGIWEKILAALINEPDFEWGDERCQPLQGSSRRSRRQGRQPGHGAHKRGLYTKIDLAVDSHGMPIRVIVTAGSKAYCSQGGALIEGIKADYLLADKAYDTDEIIEKAKSSGINPVISPKKNRKEQREYEKYLYKLRHLVENTFLSIKRWLGIATEYAKNASSFLDAVQIRCIFLLDQI